MACTGTTLPLLILYLYYKVTNTYFFIIVTAVNTFSHVPQVLVNVEESGNRLRADFSSFIASVLGGLRDRSEQEELNIISMQSA